MEVIRKYTSNDSRVIIAWRNHPDKLYQEYETLKHKVLEILKENNNDVYDVDKLSAEGNPKYAQIWGCENELLKFKS